MAYNESRAKGRRLGLILRRSGNGMQDWELEVEVAVLWAELQELLQQVMSKAVWTSCTVGPYGQDSVSLKATLAVLRSWEPEPPAAWIMRQMESQNLDAVWIDERPAGPEQVTVLFRCRRELASRTLLVTTEGRRDDPLAPLNYALAAVCAKQGIQMLEREITAESIWLTTNDVNLRGMR